MVTMLNAASRNYNYDLYQPRNRKASGYYRCVQDPFELLAMSWEDHCASQFGFWRPHELDVIHRNLDCWDLHYGFARMHSDHCGREYLLSFSF